MVARGGALDAMVRKGRAAITAESGAAVFYSIVPPCERAFLREAKPGGRHWRVASRRTLRHFSQAEICYTYEPSFSCPLIAKKLTALSDPACNALRALHAT